jgi:hypothetical protein
MKAQTWRCENCGNSGVARYDDGADVMSVVHAIEDDHKRVSLSECGFDINRIRVEADEPVDPSVPSTGNPVVDQIIREKFGEACDLTYAILIDRHPEFRASSAHDETARKTAAIIVSQLWRPMSEVIVGGMRLAAQEHGG